jgi:hypothetical protein
MNDSRSPWTSSRGPVIPHLGTAPGPALPDRRQRGVPTTLTRPHHNPRAMPIEVKDKIVRLRAVRFTGVNFEETILAWDEVHAGRSASTAHKHRF